MSKKNLLTCFGVFLCAANVVSAQAPAKLTVDPNTIVTPVSPMLYGLMTEEINHSYDGGLYAEMVSNRTMRAIWSGMENWTVVQDGNARAMMLLDKSTGPSAALPTSLKVVVDAASAGNEAGVSNPGWWGMMVTPHTTYKGMLCAKVSDAGVGPLTAKLVDDDSGKVVAEHSIALQAGGWKEYGYTLTTGEAHAGPHHHLELTVSHAGTVWLQLVSLMPPTYNNRANGNRVDLMEKMAAMKPNFIRLPGGNYLEGDTLADWYNWKKTIGPLVDRPGHQAPWSYWSTDGFGLLEFLEWTEDLHSEPVLAVYAGYALKHQVIKPGADLEPYAQAAVDEVEYTTGDASTKWGAERAKDGHPAAFPLHYIEIGNEDWFDKTGSYEERFAQIALALRKAYGTKYKLIATAPLKSTKPGAEPDVIDDHYYLSPADMFAKVHFYDKAPRNGPKIFVGEWATRSGSPTPNMGDALGDAAWMTSLERNADLIVMASYAPLLVNVNPGAMQWSTDLIGFDAATSYGSPSWYAQCLFASHLGDGTAKSSVEGAGERFFYSATVSSKEHVLHLKLVNASNLPQALTLDVAGAKAGAAKMWSVRGGSFAATNSIPEPEAIKTVESTVEVKGAAMSHMVPAYTIEVLDVPVK